MKIIAYHRTSIAEQDIKATVDDLKDFCSEKGIKLYKNKVYTDQHMGRSFHRPVYQKVKETLKTGDVLLLSDYNVLGRSKTDTYKEMVYYRKLGVLVMVKKLPATCLIDAISKESQLSQMRELSNSVVIEMLACMINEEKCRNKDTNGVTKDNVEIQDKVKKYGRPTTMSQGLFNKAYEDVVHHKVRPMELMKRLGMSKSTYYRFVAKYKESRK